MLKTERFVAVRLVAGEEVLDVTTAAWSEDAALDKANARGDYFNLTAPAVRVAFVEVAEKERNGEVA